MFTSDGNRLTSVLNLTDVLNLVVFALGPVLFLEIP